MSTHPSPGHMLLEGWVLRGPSLYTRAQRSVESRQVTEERTEDGCQMLGPSWARPGPTWPSQVLTR